MSSKPAEREFLERSIADLEAEHAAGDLTDDDLAELRARYERKLDALGERPTPSPPARRPGLVAAAVAFVAVVAVGAGVLVAANAGRREPGQTVSGGGPGAAAEEAVLPEALAECLTLSGSAAIDCFGGYTSANPEDPDGWTQFGLFAIQNGIASEGSTELFAAGETFIGRALELDPGDVEARVYLAVLLERTGRIDEAAAELARLDGVDIPESLAPLVDMVERGIAAD